jgi:hypothetical protein
MKLTPIKWIALLIIRYFRFEVSHVVSGKGFTVAELGVRVK